MTAWAISDNPDDDYRAPADHVVSPVRLITTGKPNMILENDMADKQVKVKVHDKWSVVHEGQRYVQGDTVEVPQSLADEWIRNHWVEPVTSKAKAK